MSNSVTGLYLGHSSVRQATENFTVRNFWLDISDNPEYPNTPEFQLINDKVNLTEQLTKGERVEVYFRVRGKKWAKDGKSGVNTNLDCYQIQKVTKQAVVSATSPATSGNDEELPF